MFKVGVTGGIGSGKTTVCKIFQKEGIPVFYADEEGKKLLNSPYVKEEIKEYFGQSVFSPNGTIDKKLLGAIAFSADKHREHLNHIIHPKVRKVFDEWASSRAEEGCQVVIEESAIVFESMIANCFDLVIGVTAPEEIRIDRVFLRANNELTKEKIKQRMGIQFSDEKISVLSDIVIVNYALSSADLEKKCHRIAKIIKDRAFV